jgi:hypothetical protein
MANEIKARSMVLWAEIRGDDEETSIIFTCENKAEIHIITKIGITDIKSMLTNAGLGYVEVD